MRKLLSLSLALALLVGCGSNGGSSQPVFTPPPASLSATVNNVTGTGDITVPVTFKAANVTDPVAAVQFDVAYDNTKLELRDVTAGAVATAGAKTTSFQVKTNSARVLVFGLNKNAIADGVIANLVFRFRPGVTGSQNITISQLTASNGEGTSSTQGGGNTAVITLQ